MSYNSTNLIQFFEQTGRLLSGLDLVYRMSTTKRYCYLTLRIRHVQAYTRRNNKQTYLHVSDLAGATAR